jgi:hypothetical protein
MSTSSDFPMAVKSTIDKKMYDLGEAYITNGDGDPDQKVMDLDNLTNVEKLADTSRPTFLLRWMTLDEAPADPLWRCQFYVGVKTGEDPGNYTLVSLLDALRTAFARGITFSLYDYSGAERSENVVGTCTVRDFTAEPHMFEGHVGIRMCRVDCLLVNDSAERVLVA